MQKDEFSCNKNLMHSRRNDNIENRITELQKKPENLSLSFLPNLTSLKLNSQNMLMLCRKVSQQNLSQTLVPN